MASGLRRNLVCVASKWSKKKPGLCGKWSKKKLVKVNIFANFRLKDKWLIVIGREPVAYNIVISYISVFKYYINFFS